MPKERPPILSVLLDNERKAKFQAIAQAEERSMGWVIKDMIDRVIAADSLHIYGDSPQPPAAVATDLTPDGVQTAIRRAIEQESIELERKLTQKLQTLAAHYAAKEIEPIQSDLTELWGRVDRLEAPKPMDSTGPVVGSVELPATGGRKLDQTDREVLSVGEFKKRYPHPAIASLPGTPTRDTAKAALEDAGIANDWQYQGKDRKFASLALIEPEA
jgi:hypothetical protein